MDFEPRRLFRFPFPSKKHTFATQITPLSSEVQAPLDQALLDRVSIPISERAEPGHRATKTTPSGSSYGPASSV